MIRNQRGGTMVYVLLVITVLLFTGLGATTISTSALARTKSDRKNFVALNAAQATLEIGLTQTLENLQDNFGLFEKGSADVTKDIDPIAPGCTAVYEVLPANGDPQSGWITATVVYEGRTKSVRGFVNAKDLGIWNNAIFAGTGASGQTINGNVDIRGSVHILGEGEPYVDTNGDGTWTKAETFTDKNGNGVWDPGELFTDTNGDKVWTAAEPYNDTNKNGIYDDPVTTTELSADISGGGKIGNNYSGMPLTLSSSIADIPTKGGVKTLSAEVRVKHGKLALSGTATAGQDGLVDAGLSKAKLDGIFINDGYAGNKGAGNVFSDNGTTNAYDLGEDIDINLPILSGVGSSEYEDSTGSKWTDHYTYLEAKSMDVSSKVSSITASTAAFDYSDGNGNRIKFTPAAGINPAVLLIEGVIKVPAAFQLGSKDTIRFEGSGTFYSPGNINIDGNFLPVAGKKFPKDTKVGFIAGDSINIASGAGSSQLTLMGAFYAQNRIYSAKQNQIAGTFVSNYFDMGKNVPNIYQVPELRWNLPPAMPGADPIIWLKLRGWRERI